MCEASFYNADLFSWILSDLRVPTALVNYVSRTQESRPAEELTFAMSSDTKISEYSLMLGEHRQLL